MSWITKNWIARYLKPGHKFQIGNDLWQLSGNPINEAEYEDFSRAVYKCKLLEEREGIISPAVVKIWMQTPEINTYDGWFYAGELYDLYLAENLNIAGTSDGASHFDSFGKFVAAGNSDIANDSNLTGHSDSTVGLDSDGHSDIASHPGSDSHANSVNHSDSACNSNSTTHPLCTSHSPSPNNPNVEITSPETQHSEPWTSELTCLNLLNESYSKLHHTTISKEPSNPPPYNYKPFPYAIGLTQYKQPRNFPLEGGYLVYLVMEKLPGECIHPGVFWGYWDRCERDAFRGAFEEGWVCSFGSGLLGRCDVLIY
ncbi:473b9620-7940-42d9-baf9-098597e51b38 [Sclerotinia trifoliorum]|uniref:473b9620-7940-42d9-baf9-098597e51b38 n=1 Tax=Sclerotinia trifoliorum TaxID=28548 RepID=A0A8H2ZPE9_9HELO|nr:473b9620-7940-42d9-baf9-098597e51b38 [Sclerotinia trifoliorum]